MSKLSKLIKNGIELTVNANGSYSIKFDEFTLNNCSPELRCLNQQETLTWKLAEQADDHLSLTADNHLGKWAMNFNLIKTSGGTPAVTVQLDGTLYAPHENLTLSPLVLPEITADHLLLQGRRMGGCRSVELKNDTGKDTFEGYYLLMLSRGDSTMQLSFPLQQKQPAAFTGKIASGSISNLQAGCNIFHYNESKLETDPLTICVSKNGFNLMYDYADASVEEKKDFSKVQAPGWNSWDYYRWTITEEEVLKNAEFIAADPVLSKHVKRIIVDDGWQYCYGEWEANPLFPNGMKYLANKITDLGFEPGLWFAPTVIEPHCRIAQWDYDMLAKGESGHPCLGFSCMGRYGFLLDPTQEKSRKFIFDTFARYADMGYKYFKLDFMGTTLNAKKFADQSVSHSEIQRLIVQPAYEAVKGRASILGCNYLFEGGNEYVDAVRVGGDIHATWNSIRHNTASVAARFWCNKKLWINDPDFALCRGFDTSNDPDMTRLLPSLIGIKPDDKDCAIFTRPLVDVKRKQLEILLSIVLCAGGAVNLSDKMYQLNESGLDLARRAVSAEQGEAAIPLDLFQTELPAYWLQQVKNCRRVLLINWNDKPAELVFDLKKHGIDSNNAVNFWNDQPVAVKNGRIEVTLEPRSCLFAVVR